MDSNLSFGRSLAATACATSASEFFTLPFDTLKVRLQLAQSKQTMGAFQTLTHLLKEEGIRSPWKGLTAGVHRQLSYGALRITLYTPLRDFYGKLLNVQDPVNNSPISLKILAGMTSGSISMLLANPVDVVKVRIQGDNRQSRTHTPRYPSTTRAYLTIYKAEGVRGLWTGVGPNILRNCVVNAAELSAYDQIKQIVLKNNLMENGLPLHLCAGLMAGFVATVVGSPVDVLKTRMMNAHPGEFNGIMDAVVKTTKTVGLKGYYNGFGPNFMRIGTFNAICFILLEQFRNLFTPK